MKQLPAGHRERKNHWWRWLPILVFAVPLASCLRWGIDRAPVRKGEVTAENLAGNWRRREKEECGPKPISLILRRNGSFTAELPQTFFDGNSESLCQVTHAEGSWAVGDDTEGRVVLELQIAGGSFTTIHLHREKKTYYLFTYLGDPDADNYLLLDKTD